MVLDQNDPFFPSFYFRQYRQRNVFYDILERKYAFLGDKNKKSKKSKNYDFLGNIGQQNVFYDILERKHVFLSYKNKKFKKSQT